MRKGKWIAAVCCAVTLLAGAGIIALGAMVDRVKQIPVCNPNLEEIADGACFGEYSAGPVAVKVQVAVEGQLTMMDRRGQLGQPQCLMIV